MLLCNLSYNNIAQEGKFRIKVIYDPRCLNKVVSEPFEVSYAPIINDYFVFPCDDGTMNIAMDSEGTNPLQYEIISKNNDNNFNFLI